MTKAKATKLDKEIQEGLYDPKQDYPETYNKYYVLGEDREGDRIAYDGKGNTKDEVKRNFKKEHPNLKIIYIRPTISLKNVNDPRRTLRGYDPVTDKAKGEFKVVSNIPKNGFLLRDGTSLDLSEHADILRINLNQNQFMKRANAMRVESYRDEYVNVQIDVSTTPTLAQWNALSKFPKIFYDFTDGKTVIGHGIVFSIGDLKSEWIKEQKKLYDPKSKRTLVISKGKPIYFKEKGHKAKIYDIKGIADYLRRQGIEPDLIDIEGEYDHSLSHSKNLEHFKDMLKIGGRRSLSEYEKMAEEFYKAQRMGIGRLANVSPQERAAAFARMRETGTLRGYDPKRLPPIRWYEAMVRGIKKSSDVRNPYAVVKSIWAKLSPSKKAEIKRREAKGERFRYDLPLPVDKPTRGTGTVRMVKPFKLAEVQVNMSVKDYLAARASGLFQKMRRHDGTTALVARCKSPEKNVNVFIDKAGK